MIACAAICPSPPLLARELTGRDPVVPELREAAAAAVARLAATAPEMVAVVGTARRTAAWPPDGRLDLSAFAPAPPGGAGPAPGGAGLAPGGMGPAPGGAELPLPLGLGARLLDDAGYQGPRLLQSVSMDEPGPACLRLGAGLGSLAARTALLVMADGSARRSLRAPGHLDPRAGPFDAALEQAVRDGAPGALRAMDEDLARDLLVTARPAWQVLAGAVPGPVPPAEILYRDDPFGVFYLVAWLTAGARPFDVNAATT